MPPDRRSPPCASDRLRRIRPLTELHGKYLGEGRLCPWWGPKASSDPGFHRLFLISICAIDVVLEEGGLTGRHD